jgi:hypothetical protein
MTISDDKLSAFIDGELSGDELKQIAAAIDADASLRRRVEAFAASDTILKRAYSVISEAPMPDAVVELLREPARADKVVAIGRPPARSRWPLAASVALGAGVALGLLVAEPGRMAPAPSVMLAGAVNPADALHAALETTPSGDSVLLAGARTASMVLTFQSSEGGYCREFTLETTADKTRALACRDDGQWTVKLAAAEAPGDGGYAPAASGVSAAFDAGAEALGAGEPLDRTRENALLQSKWNSDGN